MNREDHGARKPDQGRIRRGLIRPFFWFGVFSMSFIVAVLPLFRSGAGRWWSLGVATAFAFVALLKPAFLNSLNRLGIKLGVLIGKVTSLLSLDASLLLRKKSTLLARHTILGFWCVPVSTCVGSLLRVHRKMLSAVLCVSSWMCLWLVITICARKCRTWHSSRVTRLRLNWIEIVAYGTSHSDTKEAPNKFPLLLSEREKHT